MAYPGYGPPQGGYPGGGYPGGGYPGGGYPGGNQGGYYGGGAPREYYFIRSRMHGMVLDIQGGNRNAGARVHMWNKKDRDYDNQLWYDDPATGTIRSKCNDLCLDIEGGVLVMKPYQPGDPNQQWMRGDGGLVRNRQMHNKCLDIARGCRDAGATLCSWDHNGGQNQQFDFELEFGGQPSAGGYFPGQPPTGSYAPAGGYPATGAYGQRREFYIASEMNGKVLDVEGGAAGPDAKIIVYHKKTNVARNQLWYLDPQGCIRSALNDFALHSTGSGHHVKTQPFYGGPDQQWRFQERMIINGTGLCLDIKGASHHDGAEVIAYGYNGGNNQHWRPEYV